MTSTSWYLITNLPRQQGVHNDETENNNAKWTLTAMERYMRDQSDSSVSLGLVSHAPLNVRKSPQSMQQCEAATESAGEESSPSWASSSTGNTPSFGSSGVAFEFNQPRKENDQNAPPTFNTDSVDLDFNQSEKDSNDKNSTPLIMTTTCTPHTTPENRKGIPLTSSTDLLTAVDTGLELSLTKPRKSRKDSDSSVKSQGKASSGSQGGTPSKSSKLSRLLRRTHSAGCSKDVSPNTTFIHGKNPVTKTKSADSTPCSREDGDEKMKKNRKTLAQDMKMRLSFLRRRHTDSSLQSVRPSPEEAHKWAQSFHELTSSKYGLSLFRAFLSREFCEENIEFWLACEEYKRSRANKLAAKAKKIYDDFLAVQAPKEVNLDSSIRTAVYNHLQNPDRHSFDPAQRRIQGLMEQDAYVRFLQSDLYTDLAQGNSVSTTSS